MKLAKYVGTISVVEDIEFLKKLILLFKRTLIDVPNLGSVFS